MLSSIGSSAAAAAGDAAEGRRVVLELAFPLERRGDLEAALELDEELPQSSSRQLKKTECGSQDRSALTTAPPPDVESSATGARCELGLTVPMSADTAMGIVCGCGR